MKSILLNCWLTLVLGAAVPAQTNKPAVKTDGTATAATDGTATAAVDECGCESQIPLPDVLALVNGIKITSATLAANERIKQLQQEVIDARKQEVELQINSWLLSEEAKRQKTTPDKLLETEVLAKTGAPSEAEAQAFYEQNKARITGEFSTLKSDIMAYLTGQRQREVAGELAKRLRAAATIKVSSQPVSAPASRQDLTREFATVNGKKITSADVEEGLKALIFNVQEQVYALRAVEVNKRINDILLEQEANKRGITTKALLDAEVRSSAIAVTDADAEKFYNQNKERMNGEFAALKTPIIEYLTEQGNRAREQAFADRLRTTTRIQMFLMEPEPPVFKLEIDDQPLRGNPNAATTLVIFTDLQCPACAELHAIIERLVGVYGDRVKFVVRDYPLNQHKEALTAAIAAEAAREQGKYWEYVAILYQNQSALQLDKLKEYATRLYLDRTKFDSALLSDRVKAKVIRDRLDGSKLGVNSTPTIFMNGKRITAHSYEALQALLKTPPNK